MEKHIVSKRANKLLEGMRRTLSNWTLEDLYSLYKGYGFKIRSGNHPIAKHPLYPHLRATLPNHKDFAKGYISHAVKLIEKLLELEGGNTGINE